ncbi:MAG: hypothetical protein MZV70_17960 [Desulfobacterales bacterium]|nr:hypothetical protein [Desulfobacterales bacterium]
MPCASRIDRPSDLTDKVHFINSQAEHIPFRKETFDIAVSPGRSDELPMRAWFMPGVKFTESSCRTGSLIDLRPLANRWSIEVFSAREARETGHVTDLPLGLEDDRSANQAMRNAESNGWFAREKRRSSRSTASGIPPATWKNGSANGRNFIGLDEDSARHPLRRGRWVARTAASV